MDEQQTLWKQTLEVVKVSVSAATFSTWFSQTFIVKITPAAPDRQTVEIGCPSSYISNTLEKRYFGLLQDGLNQITKKTNNLIFIVKQNPFFAKTKTEIASPLFNQTIPSSDHLKDRLIRAGLPIHFTFENFAVSGSNQLAWAAANAVAKNPGHAYNPLFIWGGVGVGKTHLAIATAREIITSLNDTKVLYCTGEEFMVEIINAIRTKTTNDFKKKYRNIEVLVIDDVQFIAGKPTVQEEFFHTFNAIQKAGSQIIMTSDMPPNDIPKLADRLRSRFEAGLIVDIGQPDFELLCAILLIKVKEKEIDLPIESIQKIASCVDSPRALEGFLIKLQSQSKLLNNPITEELINKMTGQKEGVNNSTNGNGQSHQVSPQEVISRVCNYFSVPKKAIIAHGRTKTLAHARQVLMYILRVEMKLSLEEIGHILGDRDHTTVLYGVGKINELIPTSGDVEQQILGIKKQLWG
ncbi:chromosomal replication initiator protein DnaA [Candidatus Microgenomates bacterium]|nr:chromosomal replication initiator protein DnaA [Candidatus Microgenomates bacterium]